MSAFSRGLRSFTHPKPSGYICSRCVKFSTSSTFQSGHNRWSKIKHDKGAADGKKSQQREVIARELTAASKLFGSDPTNNPRLASAIAVAKRAGFPKASIETAIARGQGVSTSGAALESLILEAIMSPSIAFVVEIETDNRKRALFATRFIFTKRGGTISPTAYLFKKRGLVSFEKDENVGVDEVLEEAIEAGVDDVDVDEDGGVIVWTEPSLVKNAEERLRKRYGLKVANSEIIWDPKEDTMVALDTPERADKLMELLSELHDCVEVKAVYSNVTQGSVDDATWSRLGEKLSG